MKKILAPWLAVLICAAGHSQTQATPDAPLPEQAAQQPPTVVPQEPQTQPPATPPQVAEPVAPATPAAPAPTAVPQKPVVKKVVVQEPKIMGYEDGTNKTVTIYGNPVKVPYTIIKGKRYLLYRRWNAWQVATTSEHRLRALADAKVAQEKKEATAKRAQAKK